MDSTYPVTTSIPNLSPRWTRWSFELLILSIFQRIAAILQVLSAPLWAAIQQRFHTQHLLHPFGYCYVPILSNRLIELLMLQWPVGSESKPHSHQASVNFTKVLSGQVLERKYHISGGQMHVISERIIQAGEWAWTLPFEIHELVAVDTSAETLHIYFPGRINFADVPRPTGRQN
jgi:hypothetical protein